MDGWVDQWAPNTFEWLPGRFCPDPPKCELHSMRWSHAHPTWTFWALPWLGQGECYEIMLKDYAESTGWDSIWKNMILKLSSRKVAASTLFVMKSCWQSLTRDLYALQTSRRLEHPGAIVVSCFRLTSWLNTCCTGLLCRRCCSMLQRFFAESTDIVLLACLACPEKKGKTV